MSGVYVSYPYCRQKCTYCNFSSGVGGAEAQGRYYAALLRELRDYAPCKKPLTLYFGGGTPSLLDGERMAGLTAAVPGRPWAEATIEAAPGDVGRPRAQAWARAGISRVSLGVQSFDREIARAAGRRHDAETVRAEIETLAEAGIRRINVDLIAGLAHQTAKTWESDLDWVERLDVEHVAVYMLEVDDESRLGEEMRSGGARYGAQSTPDEDAVAAMYERAVERLAAAGLERYEISNFARPGAESLHNLGYWTMEPYFGFGADAHSFDGERRWRNVRDAGEYAARIDGGASPREEVENLDARRLLEDRLLTGLRTRSGVRLDDDELAGLAATLDDLAGRGWVERPAPDCFRLTDQGVLFANEALGELLFAGEPS